MQPEGKGRRKKGEGRREKPHSFPSAFSLSLVSVTFSASS
jgi:hypothetical protein